MPITFESGVSISAGITITNQPVAVSYIDLFGNNFTNPAPTISRQSALAYDSSDNLYAAVYVSDSVSTGLVSKFNVSGAIQWQKTLAASSPSDTSFIALDVDNSSNVYISGITAADGTLNGRDIQIAKYDTDGNLQWQKTLGTAGTLQQGLGVAVEASTGNFYIFGIFWPSSSSQLSRTIVAKYNTSGVLQWQRSLTPAVSSDDASGQDIALDSAGNVYIVGSTPTGTTSGQGFLVKYNSSGVLQWQVGLSIGTGQSNYQGIAIDSSDNIFVTGTATASGTSYGVVAKYNASGVLQWKKQIGSAGGYPNLTDITLDSSGNIYVTGNVGPNTSSYIIKYDTNGSVLWQRNLQSLTHRVQLYSITIDSSNYIVVGGYSSPVAGGSNQVIMVKLPGDGTPVGTYTASGINFTYSASSMPAADLSAWSVTSTTMSNAQSSFSEATSILTGATSTFTNSVTLI
jgi:hypothetical protein